MHAGLYFYTCMWVYKPVHMVDAHPRQSGPLCASTCVNLPTQVDTHCEWERDAAKHKGSGRGQVLCARREASARARPVHTRLHVKTCLPVHTPGPAYVVGTCGRPLVHRRVLIYVKVRKELLICLLEPW